MIRRFVPGASLVFLGLSFSFAAAVPKPNLVLITLDSTRADRMGFLGAKTAHTPNLDRLAAESIVFEHAYAQAPGSVVSHATILSGAYPQSTGMTEIGGTLPSSLPYLPDLLKSQGYREQVGGRRHAIHSEVSVTGGVVHLYPRRCLCDVRDIAASAWQQGYFLLREGGADAGTGRIDNRYGARNFDSDALGRYRQRYVPCRRLTHKNGGRNLHFSKATLVHCDLIIPRFQQRKPIEAAVVGLDRLHRARVQALQHNGCIGHHGVGGIRNGPRNIAGCERLPEGRRRHEADYQQKGDERALKTVSHLHSSKENL